MIQNKIKKILQEYNYNFFYKETTQSTMHDVRNYLKNYKKIVFIYRIIRQRVGDKEEIYGRVRQVIFIALLVLIIF